MVKTSRLLSSDTSGSWKPATVATYCPGRTAEHPESQSTEGFNHTDGSPCRKYSNICINKTLSEQLILMYFPFFHPKAGHRHVHARVGAAAGGKRRDHLLSPPWRSLHSPQGLNSIENNA